MQRWLWFISLYLGGVAVMAGLAPVIRPPPPWRFGVVAPPPPPTPAAARRGGFASAPPPTTISARQDGFSNPLGTAHPPVFITMIRYWAFAAFAVLLASRGRGGVPAAVKSRALGIQIARGTLLAVQIAVAIPCFAVIGLVRTQAIFAATPLIATVMSVLFLGERAHGLRWFAVVMGFAGVLLIIRPSGDFFDAKVLLAVLCAFMFATYVVLTRLAGRVDAPVTSFFYTGVVGCAVISLAGPWFWSAMPPGDWAWMATLCLTSITSHYLLIRAYNILDASAVQPLNYLGVVYSSLMGLFVFGEVVPFTPFIGAGIVVVAGLLSVWSERMAQPRG